MLKRKEEEEKKILDVNAKMQGNLIFSDPVNLRINGRFEGNLNARGNLIIGEGAQVEAEIIGENITISGKVKGKIKASSSLTFTHSAEVNADIESPSLAIEAGAIFNGRCLMHHERMSLGELSEFLSIEKETIRDWVNTGKLPVLERQGEELFFDRKEVEAWLARNR